VTASTLDHDSIVEVDVYHLDDLHTADAPFEGHYRHSDIHCSTTKERIVARKGDLWIPMGTPGDRFVMNVLEPEAEDSYFSWGFFDAVLQQKEWFSPYVFEDIAAELLAKDAALKKALEDKRASDPAFAADAWSQLRFVFERSPWFEQAYRRYPIYRVGPQGP
jgi:LmbE family N-acetylglucosaminyl deacetylase